MDTPRPSPPARLLALFYVLIGVAVVFAYFVNLDMAEWHQDTAGDTISATCLAHTGADEHGTRFPAMALRGYGDFKEPAFTYLLALAFMVFKPSVTAARIVSLGLGVAGLFACLALGRKLVTRRAFEFAAMPIFCFGLLSPWVFWPQYFACAPALSVPLSALLMLATLGLVENPKSLGFGLLFGAATAVMPYAYPSMKFIAALNCPLALVLAAWRHGLSGLAPKRARGAYLAVIFVAVALAPFVLDALGSKQGLTRPGQVVETNPLTVLANLASMFDPRTLFFRMPGDWSYATGYGGLVNAALFPLALAGTLVCLKRARAGDFASIYVLAYAVLAMFPASLVRPEFAPSTPHRNLIAYPAVLALAFFGGEAASAWLDKRGRTAALVFAACLWLFGGFESFKLVRQFTRSLAVCEDFGRIGHLRAIPPSWDGPERLVPCSDRGPKTAYYRYYRLVAKGDDCYCAASKTGGEGR